MQRLWNIGRTSLTKLISTAVDGSGSPAKGDSLLGVPKLSTGSSKGAKVASVDTGEGVAQAETIRLPKMK
jgi:hypothetical protein